MTPQVAVATVNIGGVSTSFSCLFQDVRVIVDNALRRFSEDRTGMSDFALESGGQNHQPGIVKQNIIKDQLCSSESWFRPADLAQ